MVRPLYTWRKGGGRGGGNRKRTWKAKQIRVDNGPEFRGKYSPKWCEKQNIAIKFIQPGRPMQNAYVERWNRTSRTTMVGRIYNQYFKPIIKTKKV